MEQDLFSTFAAIAKILLARRKLCDSVALQKVATDSDESAIEPAAEPGRDAPQKCGGPRSGAHAPTRRQARRMPSARINYAGSYRGENDSGRGRLGEQRPTPSARTLALEGKVIKTLQKHHQKRESGDSGVQRRAVGYVGATLCLRTTRRPPSRRSPWGCVPRKSRTEMLHRALRRDRGTA